MLLCVSLLSENGVLHHNTALGGGASSKQKDDDDDDGRAMESSRDGSLRPRLRALENDRQIVVGRRRRKRRRDEKTLRVVEFSRRFDVCARPRRRVSKDETEVRRAVLESRTTGMVRVVRATSGNAHSWNEKFWCARTSDEEKEEECVNVFMNDVRVVRGRVRVIRGGEKVYAVCDAGVKVRDVLEYIAERGYALKSIPWFIDQTVGGALATCTHGSSLVFGSLSSQVVGLRTMLYNGTVETVTEKTHGENVMNAFRCHANQLGITLAAIFEVIEESEAQRINRKVHPTDYMLKEIEMASAAVRRCVELYKGDDKMDWWDSCAMKDYAIRSLDDVSYYYFVPTEEAQRVKIRREIPSSSLSSRRGSDNASDDVPNEDYLLVTSASSSPARMLEEYYFKASSVGSSVSQQRVQNPNTIRNRLMQNDDLVSMWTNLWQDALEPSLTSTVASNTSHAYLAMTEINSIGTITIRLTKANSLSL